MATTKQMNSNQPNFASWSNKALAAFAQQSYLKMCEQAEQIEALRLDNRLLQDTLRKMIIESEK